MEINSIEPERFPSLAVDPYRLVFKPLHQNMKFRFLLTSFVLLGSFIGLSPLTAAPHEEGHTQLEEQMETIGKTFRSLRRSVRDPENNAESAEMVGEMLKAAKASMEFKPAWTAEQPADEQADFVAGYKKEMEKFVMLLTDLKAALEADENEKAQDLVGELRSQQRSSHKTYKKPDED